jgi:hypothetical protein
MDNVKALRYKNGMMGPGEGMTGTANRTKHSGKDNNNDQRPRCELGTHRQVTSKLCPKNPQKVEKEKCELMGEWEGGEKLVQNNEKHIRYKSGMMGSGGGMTGATKNNKPSGNDNNSAQMPE